MKHLGLGVYKNELTVLVLKALFSRGRVNKHLTIRPDRYVSIEKNLVINNNNNNNNAQQDLVNNKNTKQNNNGKQNCG